MTALRAPAWEEDGSPVPGASSVPTRATLKASGAGDVGEAVRVPAMDGFRALAILWIFLLHAWVDSGHAPMDNGIFRFFISEGFFGLDILFILSGFVIFLPAALNRGNLGSKGAYALRRFARIAPAYYLALVLALALHRWVAPGYPVPQPWESLTGLKNFVSHLLFLQTYTQSATSPIGFGIVPVVWTLTLEATFYVLLPLVARRFYRHPFVWLAAALAGAELWQRVVVPAGFTISTIPTIRLINLVCSFPTYMGHFALGMTGAWVFARFRHRTVSDQGRMAVVAVQVLSGAGLLALMIDRAPTALATRYYMVERVDTGFATVLLATFMASTAMAPRLFQWPFANRLLAGLGDTSYGVYLTHFILLGIAGTLLGVKGDGSNVALAEMIFFTLPPALALGWISCRFLEQPARLWARQIMWRSRSTLATSATSAIPGALGWQEEHGQDTTAPGPLGVLGRDHQHDEHGARAG